MGVGIWLRCGAICVGGRRHEQPAGAGNLKAFIIGRFTFVIFYFLLVYAASWLLPPAA